MQQSVVVDDQPLPKVPRVGMGEFYPPPSDSDIRSEALFIIGAAKRKREEDQARAQTRQSPGGEPDAPTSSITVRAGSTDQMNGHAISCGPNGTFPTEAPASASTTDGPKTLRSHIAGEAFGPDVTTCNPSGQGAGPSASETSHAGPSSTPSRHPSRREPSSEISSDDHSQFGQPVFVRTADQESYPRGSFEAEFAAVEESYSRGDYSTPISLATAGQAVASSLVAPQDIALGRGPSDMIPPRFHPGQKPHVVLANPANRPRVKERLDKEHQDGFQGLPSQVEIDCDGFVENVRVCSSFARELYEWTADKARRISGTSFPISSLIPRRAATPFWRRLAAVSSTSDGNLPIVVILRYNGPFLG